MWKSRDSVRWMNALAGHHEGLGGGRLEEGRREEEGRDHGARHQGNWTEGWVEHITVGWVDFVFFPNVMHLQVVCGSPSEILYGEI